MSLFSRFGKERRIRYAARLLAFNAVCTGALLAFMFLVYRSVGNSPYVHMFTTALPRIVLTPWVLASSGIAFVALLVYVGVRRGGKPAMAIAVGHGILVTGHGMALLSFLHVGGPTADRRVRIERVAGTEQATSGNEGSGYALSISPDERWLAYWEKGVTWTGRAPESRWWLCSIDLTQETSTVHRIDSLQAHAHSTVPWNWGDIGFSFDPGGWADGRLFIEHFDGTVVVDPTREQIMPHAGTPPADRSGLDAADSDAVGHAIDMKALIVGSSNVRLQGARPPTSPTLNESLADTRSRHGYRVEYMGDDVDAIFYEDESGTREILRRQSLLKLYDIDQVRVSPDRTFLAYSVFATGKAHLAIADYGTSVIIRHLPSGKEVRAGRHLSVSNMIWSADSGRLYYAGDGFERAWFGREFFARAGAGVYRVDVAATFPEKEFERVVPQVVEPATPTWSSR